jgi:hypothetical protein
VSIGPKSAPPLEVSTIYRVIAATIALGVIMAGPSALAGGRYDKCESAVADRLAELNVAPADVAGITYVPEQGGLSRTTRGGAVGGVKAWVGLESCKGSVVIHMNAQCRVKQTWTSGECRVPGLKNY